MPRARDNRKPVGTEHCSECGTLARFYQVQKGHRTGYLYRRCECGADQKTGAAVQTRWLQNMTRTDEPMIPHPLDRSTDPEPTGGEPAEPAPEKPPEPRATSEGNPEPESKKRGLIGLLIIGAGVALATLT